MRNGLRMMRLGGRAARRGLVRWLSAGLLCGVLAGGCTGGTSGLPAERSNLVLLTVSSLRADHLGIYGYRRNITPNLDLFGASGAVFLDALTPWPETGRAAAAMLTGVDPARSAHGAPARLLADESLATWLRQHGYRTGAAVAHPGLAAELGFDRGFDDFREHWAAGPAPDNAGTAETVVRSGIELLEGWDDAGNAGGEDGENLGARYFLWLHFAGPSPPHNAPPEDRAAVAADGLTPDEPLFRAGARPAAAASGGAAYGEAVDAYDATIRELDRALGTLLAHFRQGPAAGKTLVVVAGLHGESLGEHGPSFEAPRALFRETLSTPLLMGWPGAGDAPLPTETRFGSPVGIADITPTALELIGVPAPEIAPTGAIGKSLVPALRGDEPRPHRRLYAQSGGLFGVFDGRLRLLRVPVPGQPEPLFALFNLVRDPNEAENAYPQARASMEPFKAHLETRRIQSVAWAQENERSAPPFPDLSPALAEALAARGYR